MIYSQSLQRYRVSGVGALSGMILAFYPTAVFAQNITLDGTLGSAGTLSGPTYTIPQAVGTTVGNNLFHSFGRFNLDTGEAAIFQSAANIRNILSRVTGGSPSTIDGLIRTQSDHVNLFLLNPSGIIFGPHARLNIGSSTRGSFVATTVDAITFPDGGQFSAINPGSSHSLLTLVGDPSGFLASQRQPGDIQTSSQFLAVAEGQSLVLLGGNISLDSSVVGIDGIRGGRVELGSITGAGSVQLTIAPTSESNLLNLSFPSQLAWADIFLRNGSTVGALADTGGSIAFHAGNISILGSNIVAGIGGNLGTVGSQAGDITLNATGAVTVSQNSKIQNLVSSTDSVGNAGNILITARSLSVTNGSEINSSTFGRGNAGNVVINAPTVLLNSEFQGGGIFSGVDTLAHGSGGNILINTNVFSLTNGSTLNVSTVGQGNAGDILINTRSLSVTGGAKISASTDNGLNSGNVSINAKDSVRVDGFGVDAAGRVIQIAQDGKFVSEGGNPLISQIISGVNSGSGRGGDIRITTGSLLVSNGGELTANTFGQGNAGNIIVSAHDEIVLNGKLKQDSFDELSGLVARTASSGRAGNISIEARSLSLNDGAEVRASTSGQGDAGSIQVNTPDAVSISGANSGLFTTTNSTGSGGDITINSTAVSLSSGAVVDARTTSQTTGAGAAGALSISTGQLVVQDGAQVSASTVGAGRGGTLSVTAPESVRLIGTSADGKPSGLSTGTTGAGAGGELTIYTGQLQVLEGAQVSASTAGFGPGGTLSVSTPPTGLVDLIGSKSSLTTETTGTETAGNLTISTGRLQVLDGATIFASTSGSGQGGKLSVSAPESITLSGMGSLSAQATANGNSGNLTINTRALTVQDQAEVSASTVSGQGGDITLQSLDSLQVSNGGQISTATATGRAGSLSVNANENPADSVQLTGQGSGLFAQATGESGNAGNLTINTRALTLQDQAEVSASTVSGKGGDITLQGLNSLQVSNSEISAATRDGQAGSLSVNAAENVNLRGNGGLSARAEGTGSAGALTISTPALTVQDQAEVSASTVSGQGGDITLQSLDSLQVSNGGQISTATATGSAGSLSVNANEKAADSVQLTGQGSGLFAQAIAGGNAGSLSINALAVTVQDGAEVTVSSPEGQAGNLTVMANSMVLNRGNLTAVTGKSQGEGEGGANIRLQVRDLFLMGNESRISADALNTANGGNINIDTSFLIAFPPQGLRGSDIAANAIRGNGGSLGITAQGIFGIEVRRSETRLNDITASSEFGVQGEVELNTLNVDPSHGLVALPAELVDASGLIASGCGGGGRQGQSEFIVTGRGGLPDNPSDTLSNDAVEVDLVTLNPREENRSNTTVSTNPTSLIPPPLVEAQGWVIGKNGEVILTADAPTVTPNSSWQTPANCRAAQSMSEN